MIDCECCGTAGLYDFSCRRCVARAYVRSLPREQQLTSKFWLETMTLDEQEEMKRLIAEERNRMVAGMVGK
jgi:hypothetical protein